MKKDLKNQIEKTKKTLSPDCLVTDSFDEMIKLVEMTIQFIDEHLKKIEREVKKDREKK